jgi:hypothetical protein
MDGEERRNGGRGAAEGIVRTELDAVGAGARGEDGGGGGEAGDFEHGGWC